MYMKRGLVLLFILLQYSGVIGQTYSVTVTNGYGSGVFHAGDTVNVWSTAYDTTKTFDYWSGDSSFLAGAHEWHTTLIMPAQNVAITAHVRDMPVYTIQHEMIMGRDNLKNVYYCFPAGMKGVLYLFHGTGGQALNWINRVEYRSFIDAAIADSFGIIVTECEETTLGVDGNGDGKIRWYPTPIDSLANVDLANIKYITDTFINRGRMSHSTPRYCSGMSAGGAFTSEVSWFYNFRAGVPYCAQGYDYVVGITTVPLAWRMAKYDDNDQVGPAGDYHAFQQDSLLEQRGICHGYMLHDRQPIYPERFARIPGVSVSTSTNIYNELVAGGWIDANGYAVNDTLIKAGVLAHPASYLSLLTLPVSAQIDVMSEISSSNASHNFYSDWNYATLQFFDHLCNYPTYSLTLSGTMSLCAGATTTLSNTTPGGTWSSSNPAVGTVGTSGIVTGIAPGTTTISYTIAPSVVATAVVTVNATSAGTITGPSSVIVGANITLTDATGAGTWSASNSHATVSGGVVTGVSAGTVLISYTVTGSCGTAAAAKLITVGTPVTVAPITGYYFFLCAGATLPFFDATPGGSWSISAADASIASVSATGVVTGITAGTARLSYTVGTNAATAIVTVNTTPTAIGGTAVVCQGGSTQLSNATAGGVWSSGIPSVATVGSSGLVTATITGSVPIYYTLPSTTCRATIIVTINANPAGITGPVKVCTGRSITLSDATTGGSWSGTNSFATVDGSGNVTGIAAGTIAVTYTSGIGCARTFNVNVNTSPAPVSGTLTVCTGKVTFVSDATTPGISWTSSAPAIATITASGAVTGVSPGTSTITYTLATGCTTTAAVTVNLSPTVSGILGASSVSHSGPGITLSDLTGGGVWSSSNTAILGVGSTTGLVTANVSAGSAYIYYTVTNGSGCSNYASKLISTSPAPPSHGGTVTTTVGSTISLTTEAIAGQWTSSDDNIATVDEHGTINAIAEGSVNIEHTFRDGHGGTSETITTVVVTPVFIDVSMSPNPNNGSFTIHGTLSTNKDVVVVYEISDMTGQVVHEVSLIARGGAVNEQVHLANILANGTYLLRIRCRGESKVLQFVIRK